METYVNPEPEVVETFYDAEPLMMEPVEQPMDPLGLRALDWNQVSLADIGDFIEQNNVSLEEIGDYMVQNNITFDDIASVIAAQNYPISEIGNFMLANNVPLD